MAEDTHSSNIKRIGQIPVERFHLVPTDRKPDELAAWLDANWTFLISGQTRQDILRAEARRMGYLPADDDKA